MTDKDKISEADRNLWLKAIEDFSPLKTQKRVDKSLDNINKKSLTNIAHKNRKQAQPPDSMPLLQEKPTSYNINKTVPILNKIERRKFIPQSALDLHGLTKAEAFTAFSKFLMDCQERGLKQVIIITGKKATLSESGRISLEGVLRKALMQWIKIPSIAEKITGFSEARQTDGSQGAFYLRLKTRTHK